MIWLQDQETITGEIKKFQSTPTTSDILYIVFLDVDGVLNNVKSLGQKPLDENNVDNLNFLIGLVEGTGAYLRFMISSTWRISWRPYQLAQLFSQAGFLHTNKISPVTTPVVRTPKTADRIHRGDEIREFFRVFPEQKYIIIDDDSDFYEDQNFYKINSETGLTGQDAWSIFEQIEKEIKVKKKINSLSEL